MPQPDGLAPLALQPPEHVVERLRQVAHLLGALNANLGDLVANEGLPGGVAEVQAEGRIRGDREDVLQQREAAVDVEAQEALDQSVTQNARANDLDGHLLLSFVLVASSHHPGEDAMANEAKDRITCIEDFADLCS